ncbi:sigma-54-dependent Fis family transcriptional regulator [Parasulfuritortus cantonensis]|uniref:Sigma-54-dependent Fis family transcriptional regulator n=1 Tax=Parasulfuritortus cantonensis TaxID=2528202 RepID=A0A4R1B8Y7_9PROT|nr:sigma-54 dependent transcriptional regulator [Parasulfuritortus cantonensis]TCJ12923.1 sigma-54-dependent Fis family transcriptional regulator [Parasulfuritortus cantonensis]
MSEILVVDDEPGIRDLLREILEEEGHEVRLAENGEQARAARLAKAPDLVLLDIWMPDVDGLSLLKDWVTAGLLTMPVVMMSGHGTIHTAVEATRLGAFDFLEKPVPYKKLLQTVENALNSRPSRTSAPASLDALGNSEPIRLLAQRLRQAAGAASTLLLTGEQGVGADICAHFLHQPETPWVAVDELASLVERPLDWLTQAKGGMLFFAEVAQLTPLQQKGLQLILGRHREYAVNVVCASSENLANKAAAGAYSRDLYNALAQTAVRVPPLREHREDIPHLAVALLRDSLAKTGQAERRFSDPALARLGRHDWPGNLDELKSVVHNLAATVLGEVIEVADVDALLGVADKVDGGALAELFALPLKEARDAFERAYLEAVLQECGSMSRAAERSGLERTHLYRKLKQLGVKSGTRGENS